MGKRSTTSQLFQVLTLLICTLELRVAALNINSKTISDGGFILDFQNIRKFLSELPFDSVKQLFSGFNLLILIGVGLICLTAFIIFFLPIFRLKLRMREGEKFQAAEDYAKAISVLAGIITDQPKYYPAYLRLASVYRANKELNKAIEIYKTALQLHPNSIELVKCIEIVRAELELEDATKATSPGEPKAKRSVNYRRPTLKEETASRYIIQEEIGEGGMGTIYRAMDTVLDRVVALKVLSRSLSRNERALKRFLREAQSAGKLHHPNIVNIYDIGKEDDKLFIAMEYIEGDNLYDILQNKGVFSTRKAIASIIQICNGLSEAHKNGIIHRDIKPENIMIDKFNTIKIMDFGVAHIENKGMTRTGAKIGTPLYMSPEQIRGEVVDVRSDIYSLGVMLYELLTGSPPFVEGDIAYMHLHVVPKPPTTINPDISESLNKICLKAIEKERDNRFQSVDELRDALKDIHQAATEIDESPPQAVKKTSFESDNA